MKKSGTTPDGLGNGDTNQKTESTIDAEMVIAGKRYPVVRGAVKMDRDDSECIKLSDFPNRALVEFPDEGAGINVQALQKITKNGAEVVLLIRSSEDNPILLNQDIYFSLVQDLVEHRSKTKKDISFLTRSRCLVAVIVYAKGITVRDVIEAALLIFQETLIELESIEDGIATKFKKLMKKGLIPTLADGPDHPSDQIL